MNGVTHDDNNSASRGLESSKEMMSSTMYAWEPAFYCGTRPRLFAPLGNPFLFHLERMSQHGSLLFTLVLYICDAWKIEDTIL